MKKICILISKLWVVLLILSSCATTKTLPEQVTEDSKVMEVPENKALVYIYRTSKLGSAIGLKIACNETELTKLYPENFYVCILDPGQYNFVGYGENKNKISLMLEGNEKYFIEAIPRMGFFIARCKLSLTNKAEGSAQIQNCQLVGINPEAQKALNYTFSQE